ncbi:hypothetical protein RJ639_029568, partial [Escallonia herrerae]
MSPPPATACPSCNQTTASASASPASGSICPSSPPLLLPLFLAVTVPRCLFKSKKMRFPKRLCLSLFCPPEFRFVLFSPNCFRLGTVHSCAASRALDQFPNGRRGFRSARVTEVFPFSITLTGAYHLPASFTMDGTGLPGEISCSQISTCTDGGQHPCIWSSLEGGRGIDIGKQIFCNRSLNMKSIAAIGFDMDYTLAQYKPDTFESLAYEGTVRKLVYDLGYPKELLELSFDWKYMVRGLVLDKKRGNILKMDRHKYVKVAYHGFKELSKEDKVAAYGSTLTRDAFDEPDYALIDTLFSLAEAYLFAQLVDFKDNNPGLFPVGTDYSRMYKDVRAAVDLCHRDGTLKQMVAKDPKRYINEDTLIVPMLKMLRDSGRSTFLVTNSLWDYTNIVMNFLCGSPTSDGSSASNFDWLQYFDVVITGSVKPSFFHENRSNLFEVIPDSGMLLNTDNGSPMPQVSVDIPSTMLYVIFICFPFMSSSEVDLVLTKKVGSNSLKLPLKSLKGTCRVFQGGNVAHLHKLLDIGSSSQVIYVGDHIYGDILRSKKVLGWRTMLVVPELEREVELLSETRDTRKQLRLLRSERDCIEDKIHHLKWSFRFEGLNADEKQKLSCELEILEFHKVWGQLMKTGYQNSRFSHQVERFACLYTSQVTNLSLYSPDNTTGPVKILCLMNLISLQYETIQSH